MASTVAPAGVSGERVTIRGRMSDGDGRPINDGVLRRGQVYELGAIATGTVSVVQPSRGGEGIIYYKNNSGLAIQFAAAGGILYKKASQGANNKTIPTEWLGSDLSAYYSAGFRPSP